MNDNTVLVSLLNGSARNILARLDSHLRANCPVLHVRSVILLPGDYGLSKQLDLMLEADDASLLVLEPLEDEADERIKQQILANLRRVPERVAAALVNNVLQSLHLNPDVDPKVGNTLISDLQAALTSVLGYNPSLPID
jgi:hypothetical protein